ncbi:MAG: GntR family transcriptional regulator [Rhodovibrionaceae bacterium]|nr:GntR family transcriptional regulator [Rhodovibrionaceae bacterium]
MDDMKDTSGAAGAATPGAGDERIERRSLADTVAERLRAMIVEGEFVPGERLPERLLCERFGISRTPLREAMKSIAAEGLVKLLPNRGAVIPPITLKELHEAFEVMEALEATAGELACRRIDDAALKDIRRLHERMLLHYRDGDLQAYFELNQQIHKAIIAAAHNALLSETYRRLSGRVLRARYAANLSGERWAKAIEEHEAILEALEARDSERLGRLLREHLHNKLAAASQSPAVVQQPA